MTKENSCKGTYAMWKNFPWSFTKAFYCKKKCFPNDDEFSKPSSFWDFVTPSPRHHFFWPSSFLVVFVTPPVWWRHTWTIPWGKVSLCHQKSGIEDWGLGLFLRRGEKKLLFFFYNIFTKLENKKKENFDFFWERQKKYIYIPVYTGISFYLQPIFYIFPSWLHCPMCTRHLFGKEQNSIEKTIKKEEENKIKNQNMSFFLICENKNLLLFISPKSFNSEIKKRSFFSFLQPPSLKVFLVRKTKEQLKKININKIIEKKKKRIMVSFSKFWGELGIAYWALGKNVSLKKKDRGIEDWKLGSLSKKKIAD